MTGAGGGSTVSASGLAWCALFPTSNALGDLAQPFQTSVVRCLGAWTTAGGKYTIAATYRPPERAYLMHFACMIAQGGQDPALVPPMAGIDIDWTCGGDIVAARAEAKAMMATYGIVYPAALQSRHTQRLAIDIDFNLDIPRSVAIGNGLGNVTIGTDDFYSLYHWAAGFGLIHLNNDAPHFSVDGH